MLPGDPIELNRVIRELDVETAFEQAPNVLSRQVQGRSNDVARRITRELHYELAKIRFDHADSKGLQVPIEVDLLSDHRLALDCQRRALVGDDLADDPIGLLGVGREVDLAARRL